MIALTGTSYFEAGAPPAGRRKGQLVKTPGGRGGQDGGPSWIDGEGPDAIGQEPARGDRGPGLPGVVAPPDATLLEVAREGGAAVGMKTEARDVEQGKAPAARRPGAPPVRGAIESRRGRREDHVVVAGEKVDGMDARSSERLRDERPGVAVVRGAEDAERGGGEGGARLSLRPGHRRDRAAQAEALDLPGPAAVGAPQEALRGGGQEDRNRRARPRPSPAVGPRSRR